MATLDSLPVDQRAVLQLVLGRGRSYDEIARLLSIDPGAVRERALAALDALGPQTKVPADRRALIGDYLLGQLPEYEVDPVRDRLAESPSERAWARVLSSELAPVSKQALPDIPIETSSARAAHQPAAAPPPRAEAQPPSDGELDDAPDAARGQSPPPHERRRRRPRREPRSESEPEPSGTARSSRVGGAVLIGAALVLVAVVLFLVLHSSGGSSKQPVAATSSTSPTAAAPSSSTGSTTAKVISQINLTPPTAGSKSAGIAEVLSEGATDGIAIVAQRVAANTTRPPNAYAVWLYNSPSDAHILGFVNPGVTSTGRLSTAGGLPSNASHYKQLIVTQETSANPKVPGQIILQGTLTGL